MGIKALCPLPPPCKNKMLNSGGSASNSWSLEYAPGSDTAELKRSSHSTLAALNRLHKGVGGGLTWTLLSDSYAIAMIVLGISGIWMWMRGRTPRAGHGATVCHGTVCWRPHPSPHRGSLRGYEGHGQREGGRRGGACISRSVRAL